MALSKIKDDTKDIQGGQNFFQYMELQMKKITSQDTYQTLTQIRTYLMYLMILDNNFQTHITFLTPEKQV